MIDAIFRLKYFVLDDWSLQSKYWSIISHSFKKLTKILRRKYSKINKNCQKILKIIKTFQAKLEKNCFKFKN